MNRKITKGRRIAVKLFKNINEVIKKCSSLSDEELTSVKIRFIVHVICPRF